MALVTIQLHTLYAHMLYVQLVLFKCPLIVLHLQATTKMCHPLTRFYTAISIANYLCMWAHLLKYIDVIR